jgi:hypothetical protein
VRRSCRRWRYWVEPLACNGRVKAADCGWRRPLGPPCSGRTLLRKDLVVFPHLSYLGRIGPLRTCCICTRTLLCNSSVGICQGTSIGDRDEKVPLSLGHAHALSTRSDRPHPGSSRDCPLSPLVHILRSQRRRELWLCFIRTMQVDGGGEHGHLHAQWAVSAAKHPTTTVEDRAHRSKLTDAANAADGPTR